MKRHNIIWHSQQNHIPKGKILKTNLPNKTDWFEFASSSKSNPLIIPQNLSPKLHKQYLKQNKNHQNHTFEKWTKKPKYYNETDKYNKNFRKKKYPKVP